MDQVARGGYGYQAAQRLLTGEAKAAITGARLPGPRAVG